MALAIGDLEGDSVGELIGGEDTEGVADGTEVVGVKESVGTLVTTTALGFEVGTRVGLLVGLGTTNAAVV